MASPAYTTSDFVQDVRDAALLPSSTVPGTDTTHILRVADAQMRGHLEGVIRKVSEEYYIRKVDLSSPAGQRSVRLPSHAAGSSTRTVDYFAGPSANTGINTFLLRRLQRVEPERLPTFQPTDQYQGLPWGFYLEASTINLLPIPAGLGTLRVRYQYRPGKLVIDTDTASADVITSVGTTTVGGLACYIIGTGTLTISGSNSADIIAGSSPFETLASATVNKSTNNTFLQSDFSTPPQVGDWLTLPDLSPVVQLPTEMEPVLVYYTAGAILMAKGRSAQAKDMMQMAKDMEASVVATMAPRTKGNVRVLTGGIRSRMHGPWGFFKY